MATLIQTCRVSLPPPGTSKEATELTLPLTFFDIIWTHFHPIRRILFYDHLCSKSEFLTTIIPNLKQSLSLTLQHFLPAAGNLLYPSDTDKKPLIRYSPGDSVEFTIAESAHDFEELTASHARDADQFYDFVPELPSIKDEGEFKLIPLMALQVTLFPDRGICIGIVYMHCLGDGRAFNSSLIFSWALINKFGWNDDKFLLPSPNFDRSLIKDPIGIDNVFWEVMRQIPFNPPLSFPLPTKRVRATYTFRRSYIEKLKIRVLAMKPELIRVSSFVVTVSYIWSCLMNSAAGDYELERLVIPIDARERMNGKTSQPVPGNYFGNCIGFAVTTVRHDEVTGDGGFETAAAAVAEEIKSGVKNVVELPKGAENWLLEMPNSQSPGIRVLAVAGSPKFDLSESDFGWGKAAKMENLTIDEERYSTSLCNLKEYGGLEYGLSLPEEWMEAFATLFDEGLKA